MSHETAIAKCDDAIDLIESGLASQHEVMQAMAFKQKLGEIYRAINARFEQAAIQWIEKNGEIEDGDKRFYVGTVTNRKCKDIKATMRALLEATGGDLDALALSLSSSCFKPATAMEMLGATATEHFSTETVLDLKTGKPRKALKGVPKKLAGAQAEDAEPTE